jgi:hypothetical protein
LQLTDVYSITTVATVTRDEHRPDTFLRIALGLRSEGEDLCPFIRG